MISALSLTLALLATPSATGSNAWPVHVVADADAAVWALADTGSIAPDARVVIGWPIAAPTAHAAPTVAAEPTGSESCTVGEEWPMRYDGPSHGYCEEVQS